MALTITSANMSLPVPVVGQEPGPQYATDINNCLTIIDQHNHSSGSGVQINPDGLNINADLPLNNNNLTAARSLRLQVQPALLSDASDLGCLYEVGDDLYYNDGLGNQVRITQSGAVAGTPGSIANLTSPASASYVSANETFVWQSDVNTAASMDFRSAIFRNSTASSAGLTLQPPAAMGSDFTLTLPTIPASGVSFVTMNNSGAMATNAQPDGTTLAFSSNVLQIIAGGVTATQLASNSVTTAKILDANVTRAKLAALGQQLSASSGTFSTSGTGSYTTVTNLTTTITSTGRPIAIQFLSDGSGTDASWKVSGTSGAADDVTMRIQISRGGTPIANFILQNRDAGSGASNTEISVPPGVANHVDIVAAGTYTYTVEVRGQASTTASSVIRMKMLTYEIG